MSEFDIRWTERKIAQRLSLIEPLVYSQQIPLSPFRYKKLDSLTQEPPVDPKIKDRKWEPLVSPGFWSEWETNFILRTTFKVPMNVSPDQPVVLYLPLGEMGAQRHPEALAYFDGIAYAAVDRHHHELRLMPEMRDGKEHSLAISGWTSFSAGPTSRPYMRQCSLSLLSQPTRDFIALARVTLNTATSLPESDPTRSRLFNALEAAFKCLDLREPLEGSQAFYESIPQAYHLLRQAVSKAGAPQDVKVYAAGHAHIDIAWLWTLNHTRQKARRTFYTVLRNMELFPFYTFTQSQPQLYDFVRQNDPGLFEDIQERVAEGKWEPIGGMWVEADCNLSGSESLARQFVLGRAFFKKYFGEGAESPVLWLPDVFGYAWNLPQLIREAGMQYFFTIKIGWNQYNRLPYDSFWWQGLDGTRVLTHFSTAPEHPQTTASTYNSDTLPEKVIGAWTNFQQKELVDAPLLISYGHGDGGGGPERAQIENVRELSCFPAVPQMKAGKVSDFFSDLERSVGDRLPVWNGELYLEYHRGTYTSQARSKRANRKSEFALHDSEFLSVLASGLDPSYRYPSDPLRRAWELVCLNQFHDILPGSSIHEVYAESMQQYAEVAAITEEVKKTALECIAEASGGDLLLINPTSFVQTAPVFIADAQLSGKTVMDENGAPVQVQLSEKGAWVDQGEIQPFSAKALKVDQAHLSVQSLFGTEVAVLDCALATPQGLENERLKVEINAAGDITRIYDKTANREVLPEGAIANQFQAFEDRPMFWDAWDIDVFYDDKRWLAEPADSIRVLEAGPLHASLEIKRKILNSMITQVISLAQESSRLDFVTTVDWKERHILLKVAFPVDILSPAATYEIQWGNVQRPTHRNTSWDWARFETCAQKWVDLSEGNFGVSLLNDCKYGHDIRENIIRLSLLRSPTNPDPEADQGEQHFTYSLFPHAGNWDENTIAAAYAINDPVIVYKPETSLPAARDLASLVAVDSPNLVIETLKQAEDGEGWIVRLYESQRRRGTASIQSVFPMAAAWKANIIEENQEELKVRDGRVEFSYRPYQIITLRLKPE